MAITIERITPDNATLYEAFLHADEGEGAVAGFRASRALDDWLTEPYTWLLLALAEEQPAGAAVVVRIPKADARRGFLFVDELSVLPHFRRQGVARALLNHIEHLAQALGLAGVRLLVRPENAAARRLYQQAGFRENESVFCEKH
jgi:ribosomal protein S18 acetylase RimI-like enzyme